MPTLWQATTSSLGNGYRSKGVTQAVNAKRGKYLSVFLQGREELDQGMNIARDAPRKAQRETGTAEKRSKLVKSEGRIVRRIKC